MDGSQSEKKLEKKSSMQATFFLLFAVLSACARLCASCLCESQSTLAIVLDRFHSWRYMYNIPENETKAFIHSSPKHRVDIDGKNEVMEKKTRSCSHSSRVHTALITIIPSFRRVRTKSVKKHMM
jgi:hypothetical protein